MSDYTVSLEADRDGIASAAAVVRSYSNELYNLTTLGWVLREQLRSIDVLSPEARSAVELRERLDPLECQPRRCADLRATRDL
jgi:hypothetical protein